jgi:hypothetical protein
MKSFGDMTRAVVLACLAWTGTASADVVTDWNQIIMASTGPGRPGPIAFHDVAVAHLAMHDAIQSYEGRFEPYYVQVSNPKGSKTAAAATAAYRLLVTFYPSQAATLDATYGTWLANNGLTGNAGIEVGEEIAARYAGIRRADPNPPLAPFTGGTNPGEWRPTAPAFAPMAFEQQAYFIPLALTGPARFRAPPPPALTSARYKRDYNEVKAKGALTGSTRTARETDIAWFWSDNPGNIWFGGLRAIAEQRVPNTGNRARLFALASMSVSSAIISAWDSKRYYNLWRPITAIQEGDNDTNDATVGDPDWVPFLTTPPYPDYTSGANSVSGAVTKSLELFFGRDDISFSLTSTAAAAIKKVRTYPSFSAAAQQVVTVRVLQGIHFRFADSAARDVARAVAEQAYDNYLRPVSN